MNCYTLVKFKDKPDQIGFDNIYYGHNLNETHRYCNEITNGVKYDQYIFSNQMTNTCKKNYINNTVSFIYNISELESCIDNSVDNNVNICDKLYPQYTVSDVPTKTTNATITESTITESTITESTITNATITESTITESTITNATITESTITNATITEPTTSELITTPTSIKSISNINKAEIGVTFYFRNGKTITTNNVYYYGQAKNCIHYSIIIDNSDCKFDTNFNTGYSIYLPENTTDTTCDINHNLLYKFDNFINCTYRCKNTYLNLCEHNKIDNSMVFEFKMSGETEININNSTIKKNIYYYYNHGQCIDPLTKLDNCKFKDTILEPNIYIIDNKTCSNINCTDCLKENNNNTLKLKQVKDIIYYCNNDNNIIYVNLINKRNFNNNKIVNIYLKNNTTLTCNDVCACNKHACITYENSALSNIMQFYCTKNIECNEFNYTKETYEIILLSNVDCNKSSNFCNIVIKTTTETTTTTTTETTTTTTTPIETTTELIIITKLRTKSTTLLKSKICNETYYIYNENYRGCYNYTTNELLYIKFNKENINYIYIYKKNSKICDNNITYYNQIYDIDKNILKHFTEEKHSNYIYIIISILIIIIILFIIFIYYICSIILKDF